MPSSAALLDARVRQLSSLADNNGSTEPQNNPPSGEQNPNNAADLPPNQSSALDNLLEMVLYSPPRQPPTGLTATLLISLSEGLPLIPKKMLEKIQAGEYIDFSDLPPAKGRAKSLPPHWEGHILVVQLKDLEGKKRLIPDFQTWAQCFAMYAAALVMRYPDKFGPLMSYMSDMAKNARKYKWPSWVVYDQNIRMHMATTAGQMETQRSTLSVS